MDRCDRPDKDQKPCGGKIVPIFSPGLTRYVCRVCVHEYHREVPKQEVPRGDREVPRR